MGKGRPLGSGQIKSEIIKVLDEQGGKATGIFDLGYRLIGCQNIHWMRLQLIRLESEQEVTIEDHGAGRAKTIIKRCKKDQHGCTK